MKPCLEGKPCRHEEFDWGANMKVCGIDYDGENCPYTKPWGKRKYRRDHTPSYGKDYEKKGA